ncbi:MAG: hypothetical protein PVG26_19710 [Desulfobacterales bacterium]|jgi:hypothetical protein
MVVSQLIDFFSRLAESAGLYPNVLLFMLLLLLSFIIAAIYILTNLRRADRELVKVERELDELALNLERRSTGDNSRPTHPATAKTDPKSNRLVDRPTPDHITRKSGIPPDGRAGVRRHVLGKMKSLLPIKDSKNDSSKNGEEFTTSLTNNSDLKIEVLGLISKTDKSISLQHLAKHLSGNNFDGNYHPIINELEQLEAEGEIEGQVINGKVFYKKKQKTERQYILRKGRNFRKYIG